MNAAARGQLRRRIDHRIQAWRVLAERSLETESSVLVFGRRDGQPIVLKVLKHEGDEWRSGEVLELFEGSGTARVYEYADGAVLMERLIPGHSLVKKALAGGDDRATEILAEVIDAMPPRGPTGAVRTIQDWGEGFRRYASSGDNQIPRTLLVDGERVFAELYASQTRPRLLHGDLHHYNVLFSSERGWLAIDPKGVVGEVEYEVGAAMRNPVERPDLFLQRAAIESRLERFARLLKLDVGRMLSWSFAQAVLSAIWTVEDEGTLTPTNPAMALARVIHPLLPAPS